jgi:hypothetical protein
VLVDLPRHVLEDAMCAVIFGYAVQVYKNHSIFSLSGERAEAKQQAGMDAAEREGTAGQTKTPRAIRPGAVPNSCWNIMSTAQRTQISRGGGYSLLSSAICEHVGNHSRWLNRRQYAKRLKDRRDVKVIQRPRARTLSLAGPILDE